MPKTRLYDMFYDEVSLVPSGDDPTAEVVIAKAAPTMSKDPAVRWSTLNRHDVPDPAEADMPDVIRKSDLPEEVVAYINDLEEIASLVLDDLTNESDEIEKDDDNDEDVDTSDEATEDDGEMTVDEALAKADPVVAALISKAFDDAAAANARADEAERIAKAERDLRQADEAISKAEAIAPVGGKTDDVAALLLALREKAPEEADKVEALLTGAADRIEKASAFQEIGKDDTDLGVGASAAAAAEEIRKSNPNLTKEQAIAKAYEANPALYDEARRESEQKGA